MRRTFILAVIAIIMCTVLCRAQTLDTLKVPSAIFHQQRYLFVMLPKGYDEYPNTEKKYMVAFLFDAQAAGFFDFYSAIVKHLTEEGLLQPLILIGVISPNRQFEFTSMPTTEEGRKAYSKSGGADSLALHLKNEVLPIIRQKYRTNGYNIGIGHSLGGTFVINSMLKYPQLFNTGIAISPNLAYDQDQLVRLFTETPLDALNHKFLYIAHGYGDYFEESFKPATEKFGDLLAKKHPVGLRWQFKRLDNDSHGTTDIEGIPKGLIAFNRQLSLSNAQVESFYKNTNQPFLPQVKDFYKKISEWSNLQLPCADEINQIGYNCFYKNKLKDAIAIFEWGLTLYPKNINLYDSMGEMQENDGNRKSANTYYTTALQLTKQLNGKIDTKIYDDMIAYYEGRIKGLEKLK